MIRHKNAFFFQSLPNSFSTLNTLETQITKETGEVSGTYLTQERLHPLIIITFPNILWLDY